jgi:hypothetical protein
MTMQDPSTSADTLPAVLNGAIRSLLLVTCLFCMACSRDNDAETIRARIAEGAALAEAHDIGGLLKLATGEIRAMPMDMDRRGIKGVLWRTFRHYGDVAIMYPRPTIDIDDGARDASTQFPFMIVKKKITIPGLDALRDDPLAWVDAVGDQADLYRLRLQWVKHDGDWLVDRAYLERFGRDGLR